MKQLTSVLIMIAAILAFSSCRKTDNPQPGTSGQADTNKVYLEFFTVAGGSNLNLNNQWYKNAHGDSFTVSKFNYYISNIVLKGSSGTRDYTEANSYHLVEHSSNAAAMAFDLNAVPVGKYDAITFMIGVDSLHNVSGAQSGDLDPTLGNFWSWSTGYIMLKFEGNSPQAPTADGMLMLHCGGFSGPNSVLRNFNLPLTSEIEVTKSGTPHIHLQADILALFKAPNVIDFSKTTTIHMPGTDAKMLADNYANIFTITYAGL